MTLSSKLLTVQPQFNDIKQGTEEWHALRLGRVTASNFGKVMANGSGAFGKGADEYAMKKALELMTGKTVETFKSEWMDRGNELEPVAREMYEMETFSEVKNGGFVVAGWLGASIDGLINDNGGIEIKCVKFNTHFDRLRKGGFDTTYQWQVHGNIWLYDLQWIDFVQYCPDFPEHKQLYTFRVNRDEEKIQMLSERLYDFKKHMGRFLDLLK